MSTRLAVSGNDVMVWAISAAQSSRSNVPLRPKAGARRPTPLRSNSRASLRNAKGSPRVPCNATTTCGWEDAVDGSGRNLGI